MNFFNIFFKHTTKNFEFSVNINVNKIKLEDTATKWEVIQN